MKKLIDYLKNNTSIDCINQATGISLGLLFGILMDDIAIGLLFGISIGILLDPIGKKHKWPLHHKCYLYKEPHPI